MCGSSRCVPLFGLLGGAAESPGISGKLARGRWIEPRGGRAGPDVAARPPSRWGRLEEEGILLFILFSSGTGAGDGLGRQDGVRSDLCLRLKGLHSSLGV